MKRTTALDYLYLGTYHLFRGFVLYTPKSIRFAILKGLARLAYFIDRRHRHVAFVNLDIAFGDTMSEKEKKRIVKKSYENLIFNLADYIKNQNATQQEILNKVTFENEHHLKEALKHGPIIGITAHYGHWELLSLAVAAKYGPLTIVGRPLDSKRMNEILKQNRERFDIQIIPKKGALKGLLHALKDGRSVGLLVDQNTAENDGILIDFFGKKARHTPAAAILSRRLGAKIVPMFIRSDDHSHYTITFYPPLEIEKSKNKEEDILKNVQAQANITESVIREKPDEWFWLHKRWKNQYEALYR